MFINAHVFGKHGALIHIEAVPLLGEGDRRGGEGWEGSVLNPKMFTMAKLYQIS